MSRGRMNTRVIKEVSRLKSLGLSVREISRSVNRARSSVHDLISKASDAGIGWPLREGMDDEVLERLLYPEGEKTSGVTRQLLWEEYAQNHPGNHYSYSRYCEVYDA